MRGRARARTLAGTVTAAALLLALACSTVPEVDNHLPQSPTQPFVPASGQAAPVQIVVKFANGSTPADGGSVSVQRADSASGARCGAAPCLVLIAYQGGAGYLGELSLGVGQYVVTYEPPSGYHLVDGVDNPQIITVPNPPPPRMLVTFTVTP